MRTKKILNAIEEVDRKVTTIVALFEKFNSITGNMLVETVEQKSKLEEDKNKLLGEKIELKDALAIRDKLTSEQEKDIASNKETIKNLTSEINKLVKYKNENESLDKELKKVKKELTDLKEKGVVLPKKVPATKAKPQTMKETVRPVKN